MDRDIPSQNIEKKGTIAVLALGRIGDTVLTTPLFYALRSIFPDARIEAICNRGNAPIAAHCTAVDSTIAIPSGIRGVPAWIRVLLRRTYDLYIDPKNHASTTSRIAAQFVRARQKMVTAPNLPFFSNAEIVPPAPTEHHTDIMLQPARMLRPEVEFDRAPHVALTAEELESVRQRTAGLSADPIVVNISAGRPARRWTGDKWKQLIEQIQSARPLIVIGDPSESAMARSVADSRSGCEYAPTPSIIDAAALISQARLLITSDTSVVHLASAFSTPVVVLYNRPRTLETFGPIGTRFEALFPPSGERADRIEVGSVLEAITRIGRDG